MARWHIWCAARNNGRWARCGPLLAAVPNKLVTRGHLALQMMIMMTALPFGKDASGIAK